MYSNTTYIFCVSVIFVNLIITVNCQQTKAKRTATTYQYSQFATFPQYSYPQFPSIPQIPNYPQYPNIPQFPNIPQIPNIPHIPNVPNSPNIPQWPHRTKVTGEPDPADSRSYHWPSSRNNRNIIITSGSQPQYPGGTSGSRAQYPSGTGIRYPSFSFGTSQDSFGNPTVPGNPSLFPQNTDNVNPTFSIRGTQGGTVNPVNRQFPQQFPDNNYPSFTYGKFQSDTTKNTQDLLK